MAAVAPTSSTNPLKAWLGRYFRAHGQFCARHPWEVIVSVVTLTVCVLSIGVLSGGKVGTLCGINKPCKEEEEEVRSMNTCNSCGKEAFLACLYPHGQL